MADDLQEATMRAAAELFRLILIRRGTGAVGALSLVLAGCASPPPVTAEAPGTDLRATDDDPNRPIDRATTLSEQAERDVEMLQQLRASAGPAAPPEPPSAPETRGAGASSPSIKWNEPPRQAAREPDGRAPAAAVLPRANETIEVRPPPASGAGPDRADVLRLDQLDLRLVQLRQGL